MELSASMDLPTEVNDVCQLYLAGAEQSCDTEKIASVLKARFASGKTHVCCIFIAFFLSNDALTMNAPTFRPVRKFARMRLKKCSHSHTDLSPACLISVNPNSSKQNTDGDLLCK